MSDQETFAHRAWLGYVQPVGLVVSVPALLAAQAYVRRDTAQIHEEFLTYLETTKNDSVSKKWQQFVLDVLQWQDGDSLSLETDREKRESLEVVRHEYGEILVPTHIVVDPDSVKKPDLPPLALVQCLEQDTDFDEISGTGSKTGWQAARQLKFERLLRENQVPIGILFNGSSLRLVYSPRGESSGYITFRFDEMKTVAGRPIFAGLYTLLHTQRMFELGEEQRLPHILSESRKYQNEVSTQLADQVMLALFELLRGFQAADVIRPIEPLRKALDENPNSVYDGLLAVLLRLVFILYAEDRSLMSDDSAYTRYYSVTGLFEKLRGDFGRNPDTMDLRHGAWSQLLTLFRLVHRGGKNGKFNLPERKGRLFDPERFPFLEGSQTSDGKSEESDSRTVFENIPQISDGVVYRVLKNLLMLNGERLSYRTLDVEQIGSVYEAIMGFHLEVATGLSVAIKAVKSGGAPTTINLEELLQTPPSERSKIFKDWTDQKLTGNAAEALSTAKTVDDLMAALDRKIEDRITPEPVPEGSMTLQPSDERRRSGSHYTPKHLTEPIVQMALKPILESLGPKIHPDQIKNLKICDPAMGSGAFLVEACRQLGDELVAAWHRNDCVPTKDIPADEDELLYARRLVAQRCLYGVDINPMATDLAKLSLWLVTLAKHHAFTFLDHCLRSGDSLVGLTKKQIAGFHWTPTKQQDFLRKAIESRINTAMKTRNEILNAPESVLYGVQEAKLQSADATLELVRFTGDAVCAALFAGAKEKQRLEKLAEFRLDMAQYLEGEIAPGASLRPDKLVSAVEKMRSGPRPVRPFHWEIEFPEVFEATENRKIPGFDAVVGNPPYVQLQKNGGELSAIYERFGYATFDKTGDIYCLFYELGYNLLRPGGVLGFITSNKWMRAGYGENTREFLAKKTNPLVLVDFAGAKVFEDATVDVNVLLFSKEKNEGKTQCSALQKDCAKEWSVFLRQQGGESRFDTKDSWVILSPIEQRIKAKIEAVGVPLANWDVQINYGIKTGFNEAFIINGAKKDELIAQDPKSGEIIRPLLRGRDIKRYAYEFADLYLITTFPSLEIDIEAYPAVKEHLLSFGYDRLKQTGEKGARKKTNNKWFETQDSISYWEDFYRPKIIWKIIGNQIAFSIDSNKYLVNNACYILTGPYLEYLLAVLNSSTMKWYSHMTNKNKTGAGDIQVGAQNVNLFPIPLLPEAEQKIFVALVNKLQSETENLYILESEIDSLVYAIYGFSKTETEIIRSAESP